MAELPALQQRGTVGMAERPWRSIDAGMRAEVERLYEELMVRRGGAPLTASWELDVWDKVQDLVDEAMVAPASVGLEPLFASRLTHDPAFQHSFKWSLLVRSSLLWPLSLAVYSDVEEIRAFGADLWIVQCGEERYRLSAPAPADLVGDGGRDGEGRLEEWFRGLLGIAGMQGRTQITTASPLSEATVATAMGAVRIAAIIRPAASGSHGIHVTVRVPRITGPTALEDFVDVGTIPRGVAAFLRACVQARLNMMIAGGTGTGKTTLLRALCAEIPQDEILFVIEDTPELGLTQLRADGTQWHPLVISGGSVPGAAKDSIAPVTLGDLAVASLRHRPDRIILGEGRGAEMAEITSAMTNGHDGSMVTVHANSAIEAIERSVQLVMGSASFLGQEEVSRRIVHQAIHVVVHLGYVGPTRRRALTGVVAYSAEGAPVVVYGLDENRALVRQVLSLAQLPHRIAQPLEMLLDEVPS